MDFFFTFRSKADVSECVLRRECVVVMWRCLTTADNGRSTLPSCFDSTTRQEGVTPPSPVKVNAQVSLDHTPEVWGNGSRSIQDAIGRA